jgi:hypothetical protein
MSIEAASSYNDKTWSEINSAVAKTFKLSFERMIGIHKGYQRCSGQFSC